MDPRYWAGDDDRDLGPDYDIDRCPSCGAADSEDCEPSCACEYCTAAGRAQAGPQKGAA